MKLNDQYFIADKMKNGNIKLIKTELVEIPNDYKPPLEIYTLEELFDEILKKK